MKRLGILIGLITISLLGYAQQDAQYSQYMFNGIYINPAYAGYKEQLNIHSFYRNQWVGIQGSPKSMSIAIDGTANEGNIGLALQVASDKLGAQSSISSYLNFAYRLRVNYNEDTRLSFGIGFGAVQNSIDGNRLNTIDIDDSALPRGMQSNLLPDARAGVFYNTNRWYAGFSVDNLIAQYAVKQVSDAAFFPTQKAHYYLTAGVLLPINEDVQLKPSFLLKDDRAGPSSLDISTFALIADKVWIGGSYRTAVKLYNKAYLQKDLNMRNSLIAMTEIFATPQLRIGYAFDYSLNDLANYSGGTHEISIGFYFKSKNVRMVSPRYF